MHLARHVECEKSEACERYYLQLLLEAVSLRELCPLGKLWLISKVQRVRKITYLEPVV